MARHRCVGRRRLRDGRWVLWHVRVSQADAAAGSVVAARPRGSGRPRDSDTPRRVPAAGGGLVGLLLAFRDVPGHGHGWDSTSWRRRAPDQPGRRRQAGDGHSRRDKGAARQRRSVRRHRPRCGLGDCDCARDRGLVGSAGGAAVGRSAHADGPGAALWSDEAARLRLNAGGPAEPPARPAPSAAHAPPPPPPPPPPDPVRTHSSR